MNNQTGHSPLNSSKKYSSLSLGLVLWFLVLSLLPLGIVSWISYQQANNSLTQAAAEKLEQSAKHSVGFIRNWFDYRFMDLKNQAEASRNSELLVDLVKGFQQSGKPLSEYIQSDDWSQRVKGAQNDLITLSRDYDYIYDLFLIDTQGNILFTVAHESDLGTNLLTGDYSDTRFARSVKTTLETGASIYSDLEHYAPSNNIIAGFLTAPITDASGSKLGVFAMQIRFDRVAKALQQSQHDNSSLMHYLVGDDGKLRSPISGGDDEVLSRSIDTEQYQHWHQEHASGDQTLADQEETAFAYLGPNNKQVIGIHNLLLIPGVHWALISEVEVNEALASAMWLRQITIILVLLTGVVVVFMAIYLARRISLPITTLAKASREVAAGALNQQVKINARNEIGQLAEAFNHMLMTRQTHEQALQKSNTQAQQALAELAESNKQLELVLDATDVGVWDWQVQTGEVIFNERWATIIGYSLDELKPLTIDTWIKHSHPDDLKESAARLQQHWKGETARYTCEARMKHKQGHWVWVLDTGKVVEWLGDGKPKRMIGTHLDITERKRVEVELINAKETAEEATRLKSEFLANMSHEIRTPMNGVIGMTGLLLDTELTSKQRDYARTTMKSADALLTLINDILDFSKIEAGKLELESVPFDLQSLAEDVSEMMAIKCREKNLEMLLRYKPGTPRYLIGDPGRIRQILLNLLSNAIKFTEQGSILLTIESQGVFYEGKVILLVKVKDNGIGIATDKLDKIFNKFDQEDGSTTRKYGGTGLGLAICRQLCEMMQGVIVVESQKGKGSTFSFTIALDVSDQLAVVPASLGNATELNGIKTLIVDDMEIARTILSEQLLPLKLRIDKATSGKEALEKLSQAIAEKDPYQIVVTDFHMPEMDGEMLAAEIQQRGLLQDGVMLFVTSSPRKGDGNWLKQKGFDGYLTKPTHPSEVPQILSLIWSAKLKGQSIPLVTRHTLQEANAHTRRKLQFGNTHVLLTEDNPVNQMVANEYLERYGCIVTPAGNGLEALAQIKQHTFDLIFMDCQMPEMDGFEATAEIRKRESQYKSERTPIIAFTANAMAGDKEKCLNAGMDDYVSKPVSQNALEDILAKWLPHKIKLDKSVVVESIVPQESPKQTTLRSSDAFDAIAFDNLRQLFKDKFAFAVEQHVNNAKENIQRAEQAITQNDMKTLERIAHSLKGSGAQFGALELSKLSAQMEHLAKQGERESIRKLFSEMQVAQQQVAQIMLQQLKS